MRITFCKIYLQLPYIESLKGRRKVINSIKSKLKKLNISILDISGEYAKEVDFALVFLSPDTISAKQYENKIELLMQRNFCEYDFEIICEEI